MTTFSRLLATASLAAALAAILPATSARAADQLDAPARAALLDQLRATHAKQPCFESTFTEQRTSHLLNKPVISEGTDYFSAPDKFRREVKSPNASTTVINSHNMWIYYPSFKEVEVYSLDGKSKLDESLTALTAGLNFEHIEDYYNFTASRDTSGYRLDLIPKKPSLRAMVQELVLFLSPDLIPTRTEITLPKGDHLSTPDPNPHRPSLPPSLFDFTPPPDAHVTRPMGK